MYKPKRGREKAENVEVVIVSIANSKVKKALFECIAHTKKTLNVPIWILVDEGSELIPELIGLNLVIVPKDYRRDLVGKGRAMNFFIETKVEGRKWYTFVDDDNLVHDDGFLFEIPGYDEKGYVAMNPVLYPRRGKSDISYVMDSIRYFDDLFIFRFFTGLLKTPLIGLHGELLTVKGEVLKEIGYDNRSLTEDFRFASELVRRGYKTWQSSTKVCIKSPNSVKDFLKQRGRWFKGIMDDWKYCPVTMKIVVASRLVMGALGIFGSWAFLPLWFMWGPLWCAIPGGLYCWMVYIYGIIKLKKPHYLLAIPLIGAIEAMAFYAGLKQKTFVVIDKN